MLANGIAGEGGFEKKVALKRLKPELGAEPEAGTTFRRTRVTRSSRGWPTTARSAAGRPACSGSSLLIEMNGLVSVNP